MPEIGYRLLAYRQHYNLWRHAKPNRYDAGADAGRHEHVMAILEDVAGGVLSAETRWHDGCSNQRQVHLATVRVRGEEDRNALRKTGKNVRVVRQRDYG